MIRAIPLLAMGVVFLLISPELRRTTSDILRSAQSYLNEMGPLAYAAVIGIALIAMVLATRRRT